MRQVFAIGETVLDILFREGQPFTAKAGGASLNSSVSLGRLGIPINFIGEYGLDEVGNHIDRFLKDNNVNTDSVYRYYDGKSALALAFLNEQNDASYDFYKIYPKNRLDIQFPDINQDDIVLFGSFYSITEEVRDKLLKFIKAARKKKAIIIYDPNFRKTHLHDLPQLKPLIAENISYSDIVRGSNEDFSFIFGSRDADETYRVLGDKKPILLYTANKKGVYLRTCDIDQSFPVKKIEPQSTIGAGDSFNAGIAYSLIRDNIKQKDLKNLSLDNWEKIITTAVEFATHVCLRYDNYIAKDFAEEYKL